MFPRHGDNVEELIANGDIAMYHAKDNGRGNTHLFVESDSTREQIHRRLHWKDTIEKALDEKRLVLYFQPIMKIKSKQISHHEVLLRLVQEDGEIIAPGAFIAEAEQSSLINTIDYYVLKQAMLYLSETTDPHSKIAINLSGKTLGDENLVAYIKELIETFAIAPARIIFEVTETTAVADIFIASTIMTELTAIGCQFALDDFGIGFSSFYYLKKLPVEYIKIDGAFIRHLAENQDDQLFVQAISAVISGLGKKTVAEFVEDRTALDLLEKYGIDYAQGYYIGRPQPEPQLLYLN
jgi:EAL domain-containing protein (putative c-di-GMP-specific phosphodiesterase class I)